MIKTFRGLLADGEQEIIRLSTKKGKVGYKIVSLEIIQQSPGTAGQDNEGLVQVFKVKQSSIPATIDFSDGNLLAMGFYAGNPAADQNPNDMIVVFDNEVFNQDIFICYKDIRGVGDKMNYMLKLETFTMTDNATAVSTLRDIRLNPQVPA
jgi:hypothetical protein